MFLDIIHRSEIGTNSIHWAQLSRFYLKTETESSLWNVVFCNINRKAFLDEDRTMDNVQKHNICTNVPSSQTFRSYLDYIVTWKPEETGIARQQPVKHDSTAMNEQTHGPSLGNSLFTHHTTIQKVLEAVFSVQFILRFYNKHQWDKQRSTHCWEQLPSNAWWSHRRLYVCCSAVIYRVCRSVKLLQLPVVTSDKCSINPVIDQNPMSSHKHVTIYIKNSFSYTSTTWHYLSN
jgi:hypothetical protein